MKTLEMMNKATENNRTYTCKYECGEYVFSNKHKFFNVKYCWESLNIRKIMFELDGWIESDMTEYALGKLIEKRKESSLY